MIFQENSTSVNELILPPITQTKVETSSNSKPQEEKSEKETKEENKESVANPNLEQSKNSEPNPQSSTISQNITQKNETVEVKKIENNRYKIPESKTIPEENNQIISEEIKKSQENAKTMPNMKALSNNDNPYIAKVILENARSLKDCIFLLENHLKANKIVTYYETSQDQDKITFLFAEEKIAFDFTKIIYNEKNRNFLYKNVKVNLSLEPNKTYLRRQKLKNKKKGPSYESIMQLYRGDSYVKKVKEFPKIMGNVNLGIKSPFYVVNINRKKIKNNTSKSLKFQRNDSKKISIDGYYGYDGNPLKSYEKLKISVLDTHYKPFSNVNYRVENKKKWFCPSNFKLY